MKEKPMNVPEPPPVYKDFTQQYPDVAAAYEQLGVAVRDIGALQDQQVILLKLAIAVGARLEGAVRAHVRKAVAAGIDHAAIEQTILLAIPTIGFPSAMAALTWIRSEFAGRAAED